ncbi:DEAD/DEAH box helicase [Candidatus Falkowbacteria bacterium]|jgi:ERCC4-related helicase|nr:DEAD/DEAH box helicase [Candidatus Falkowbacteria bacterium]
MLAFKYIESEEIQERGYQFEDVAEIIKLSKLGKNIGLVWSTSLGKTPAAILVADHFLDAGKVLILGITNPLCSQHLRSCRQMFNLPDDQINMLVGSVAKKKRAALWQDSRIVVSTPQTIVNEVEVGRIDLSDVSFVVFDEMHMANKKYAYVDIARMCQSLDIRVLCLTASPGDRNKRLLLEKNYGLNWWFYRSDEDVPEFAFPKEELVTIVDYPEHHNQAMFHLRKFLFQVHNGLAGCGVIGELELPDQDDYNTRINFLRITELKKVRPALCRWVEEQKSNPNSKYKRGLWYQFIICHAAYFKMMHLLNVFVTESYQGALKSIEEKVQAKAFPGQGKKQDQIAVRIWNNPNFQAFRRQLIQIVDQELVHPKAIQLVELLKKRRQYDEKILVFVNDKAVLDILQTGLSNLGFDCNGVAGNAFMSQKQRQEILQEFTADKFKILLATNVLQAGIHVPALDVVINYTMPENGIAMIQRAGRAGRTGVGLVCYLIMQNSNDTSLFFAAKAEIKRMDVEMRRIIKIQEMELAGLDVFGMRAQEQELLFDYDEAPDIDDELVQLSKHKRPTKGRVRTRRPKVKQPELFPIKQWE